MDHGRRKLLSQEGTRPRNRSRMQNKSDKRAKFQPVDYDNRDFDKDKLDAL